MKIAIAAFLLTIVGLTCAQAQPFWQFCAARYHTPIDNVQRGFSVLGLLFSDGRRWRTRMASAEWTDCYCKDGFCECCEFEIAKICAFMRHLCTTTNDCLRNDLVCERR